MRVLVACEFSGVVRDAFIAAGHDAISCDLLPTDVPGPHIQGDILEVLNGYGVIGQAFDLMIAHPPCTYVCRSGLHWNSRVPGRAQKTVDALKFIDILLNAPIHRIALENPVGLISTKIRKPDQIIQPWQFGHGETKTTCLWLKGLPPLQPTDIVVPEWAVREDGSIHLSAQGKRDTPTHFLTGRTTRILKGEQLKQWNRIHREPPSPERWRNRSRTYAGIATAMAEQWAGA